MLPGSKIRWEIHMFAIGQEIKDQQVELAIYFYPKGFVPKHRTVLRMFDVSRGSELDIPPGEKAMTQNFYVMPAPARIENFQPHMHMRGKAMSMEAVYPDGKRELLSSVNNFQWKWHVNYVYADDAAPLLPEGNDARVHGVARQHGRQSEQSRSEAVGRLGRPHRRRDGARLGRRHLSRPGRVRLTRRRAQGKEGRAGGETALTNHRQR